MTIRISLGTVLAALVLIGIGTGTAVGVMLWEPWDGGEEKDFTIVLDTNDDFQEASQRMGAFFPDFDCLGAWDDVTGNGILECEAGLTGFTCEFKFPHPAVVCQQGEQLSEGFPVCTVQKSTSVQCSGPETDAVCRVQYSGPLTEFVVTCQKA